jgi:hypothetical protein
MSVTSCISRIRWVQVIVTLVVLALCFLSFSWFLSWLVPEQSPNVNAVFASRAWKYTLLAAMFCLVPFVFFRTRRGNGPPGKSSAEKPRVTDVILILLPLTPVVQYILSNRDILSPLGSLCILGVFAAFSAVFIIVLPTLLGLVGSAKPFMIVGLAFTFTITNMALLSAEFHWYAAGSLKIQLLHLGAVFLAGWVLYSRFSMKSMCVIIAAFFVMNSAIQSVPHLGTNGGVGTTDGILSDLVDSKEPRSTPNIYLLVYDSYVANETMLQYGIDNAAQEESLETMGFKLYPHTYSVGATTVCSMSRTFNASTAYLGTCCLFDDRWKRPGAGDGTVQHLLKGFGYATYGMFGNDYEYQGVGAFYDHSFPASVYSPSELLMKAIFMGELRFDAGFETASRERFTEHKLSVLGAVPRVPRFVYAHDNLPGHSQFSGTCRPNETALYEERLSEANGQMKRDVETIIEVDPGAIIVVAGDHGPYLTKNCASCGSHYDISEISRLDIQDRYGAFLAIRWPTQGFPAYDDIDVLQDIFPAVFAYLFEDAGFLRAKIASKTLEDGLTSGAWVTEGTIHGGISSGEPLFVD